MSNFLKRPLAQSEQQVKDKDDIISLINFERYCRDNNKWEEMYKCYADDSYVNISWYQGSGKGFVTASSKMNLHTYHVLHNSLTWINGNRAVTIIMATVVAEIELEGVKCNLSSNSQLIFSTEKINGQWYIVRFESIYEQDNIVPILPNNTLNIDSKDLEKYRPSYACIAYNMEKMGNKINDNLVGIDKPEMVQKLYNDLDRWLDGGKRSDN